MRIVCMSDLHGQQSKKLTSWCEENPADVLVYAGDCQRNQLDDGTTFLDWMQDLPYTHKLMTFGNHDGNYQYMLDLIKLKDKYNSIQILNHASTSIDNVNFFGSPYSVLFMDWWFMDSDSNLAYYWNQIPEDVNVLFTHTPVYKIHDKTDGNRNVGSATLKDRIKALKGLRYHICGHIHEGYGIAKRKNVTYINCALLDDKYRLNNLPIIFDYEK